MKPENYFQRIKNQNSQSYSLYIPSDRNSEYYYDRYDIYIEQRKNEHASAHVSERVNAWTHTLEFQDILNEYFDEDVLCILLQHGFIFVELIHIMRMLKNYYSTKAHNVNSINNDLYNSMNKLCDFAFALDEATSGAGHLTRIVIVKPGPMTEEDWQW